jgi:hypothetical protein
LKEDNLFVFWSAALSGKEIVLHMVQPVSGVYHNQCFGSGFIESGSVQGFDNQNLGKNVQLKKSIFF